MDEDTTVSEFLVDTCTFIDALLEIKCKVMRQHAIIVQMVRERCYRTPVGFDVELIRQIDYMQRTMKRVLSRVPADKLTHEEYHLSVELMYKLCASIMDCIGQLIEDSV